MEPRLVAAANHKRGDTGTRVLDGQGTDLIVAAYRDYNGALLIVSDAICWRG